MDKGAISKSFSDTDRQNAEVISVLAAGASRSNSDGHLQLIDRSKLRIMLGQFERLRIPFSNALAAFKDTSQKPDLQGTVKPIDLAYGSGINAGRGLDVFEVNRGKRPADVLAIMGIPKFPDDHQVPGNLADLFLRSEYHHSEDNWFNWRRKVHDLSPKIVACLGGSDCLSWREIIGPGYVAIEGGGLDNGFLVSRRYLDQAQGYLILQEMETGVKNPLLDMLATKMPVFRAEQNGLDGCYALQPQPQYCDYPLWPETGVG